MQRAIAMLILFVGVGLASAAGSLNGTSLTDYRSSQWVVGKYQTALATAASEEKARLQALEDAKNGKKPEAADADADADAEQEKPKTYAELVEELRALDLLGPERGLAEMVRDAHAAVPEHSADMIVALRAAGLISRDPTMAQSTAEATMRLEDLQKLADSLAEQAALAAEAGETPVSSEDPPAAEEAVEEPSTETADPDLVPPPTVFDPALAEEWTLLQRAVKGDEEAITALRAKGVVHAPASAKDVQDLLDSPKEQERAVKALVEADLLQGPETIEERLAATKASAPLPDPATRVSQWWTNGGAPWGAGVFLIIVGALMARRQDQHEQSGTGTTATSSVDFKANVTKVLEGVDRLVAELADLQMDVDAPELREQIDTLQLELIDPVVEQRGRLIARHGIAAFAEYFSPFSAGERNLARTWSALTDGHSPTAREAAARARSSFAQAHRAYMKADAKR